MPLDILIVSAIVLSAFVVAFFALLFNLGQWLSPERLRRISRGLWPFQMNLWHMMVAVAVAAFVTLAVAGGFVFALAVTIGAVLVLAWFARVWCHEVVFLMGLRDDDLPGRNDKLIWLIMLILVAPIGPWLFRSFRLAHWPTPAPAHESQTQTHAESPGTTTAAAQPA
jgi:hypothetical protein